SAPYRNSHDTQRRLAAGPRLPAVVDSDARGSIWVMARVVDFDEFFAEHYRGLVAALKVAVVDQSLAEDAAQEAFARALPRWRTVGLLDRPATWVYVVAMREARRQTLLAWPPSGSSRGCSTTPCGTTTSRAPPWPETRDTRMTSSRPEVQSDCRVASAECGEQCSHQQREAEQLERI